MFQVICITADRNSATLSIIQRRIIVWAIFPTNSTNEHFSFIAIGLGFFALIVLINQSNVLRAMASEIAVAGSEKRSAWAISITPLALNELGAAVDAFLAIVEQLASCHAVVSTVGEIIAFLAFADKHVWVQRWVLELSLCTIFDR